MKRAVRSFFILFIFTCFILDASFIHARTSHASNTIKVGQTHPLKHKRFAFEEDDIFRRSQRRFASAVAAPRFPNPTLRLSPQRTASAVLDGASVTAINAFDPYYSRQWGLTAMDIEKAWAYTRGEGTTVAVIDTGLDFTHPDIRGNVWTNPGEISGNGIDDDRNGYVDDTRGWDFYNNDNNPTDDNGHGTHVAGIIGALRNNNIGIAGVAPESDIMVLKALNYSGGGTLDKVFSSITRAIRYAADKGADVINLSLGIPSYFFYSNDVYLALRDAVSYAKQKGSIVVASAGNSGGYMDSYPALFNDVISVGSMSSASSRSYFSSYGYSLDVMAPGHNILSLKAAGTNLAPSADSRGQTMYLSGTSMAAPMVSGTIALMLAENPTLTFNDIYQRLAYSSSDKGYSGWDPYYGYGTVSPAKAVSQSYYSSGQLKSRTLASPDANGVIKYNYSTSGAVSGAVYASQSQAQGSAKLPQELASRQDMIKALQEQRASGSSYPLVGYTERASSNS